MGVWERLERREIDRLRTSPPGTAGERPRPVLKLIERKWNLAPLTRRDAAAASPLEALDLDGEPAFTTPPPLPAPTLAWRSWRP